MLEIKDEVIKLVNDAEKDLHEEFLKIDDTEFYFSKKVLDSFKRNNVSESDFVGTTGYGYNDIGRDKIEAIYADIFDAEDALVRSQFISGDRKSVV